MIPTSADEAVRMWLHLEGGGDQLRSVSLWDSEEVCSRPERKGICEGKMTTRGRRPRERFVCAKCGQPWMPTVRPIQDPRPKKSGKALTVRVRGKVPRMRRESLLPIEREGGEERGFLRRVLLIDSYPREALFKWSRGDWMFCLQALAISLDKGGLSYQQVAEIGVSLLLHLETPRWWWEVNKVTAACEHARRIVGKNIAKERRQGGRQWADESGSALRQGV